MARRLKGEGSIFFDKKNNRYRWRGTYVDANGIKKPKDIYGRKEQDVICKRDKFLATLDDTYSSKKNFTVKEWIADWLETYVKPTVEESTYKIYKEKLDYVVDNIGNQKLTNITSRRIQEMLNSLRVCGGKNEQSLAASTVNNVRNIFKRCLEKALDDGLIPNNPAKKTKPLRNDKKRDIIILDEKEANRFINAAYEGKYIYTGVSNPKLLNHNEGTDYLIRCYGLLIDLALGTGMRIGELIGLQWTDISYKNKNVNVKQQIAANAPKDRFDDPKTANSVRTIAIGDEMLKKLRDFREYQKQYAGSLGDQFRSSNLVFTNTFGSPVDYHNFYNRYYRKLVAYTGVNPKFSIHGMRHTHASILLQHGVSLQVVSTRLGHSSAAFTLKTYIHLVGNSDTTAAEAWAEVTSEHHDDN